MESCGTCTADCSCDENNIALGKTATQLSTAHDGVASRAVDGNTNGVFTDNSVTHTAENGECSWWRVDLGDTVDVSLVKDYNRDEPS